MRDVHVAYWRGLGDAVAVGGAVMQDDGDAALPVGSFLVVQAASESEARQMLEADPFFQQGVFSDKISIRRWRPAIGTWCA